MMRDRGEKLAFVLDQIAEGPAGLQTTHGDELSVHCPFHDDTNPSASLNLNSGALFCYACNRGWGLDAVVEQLGMDDDTPTESAPVVVASSGPAATALGVNVRTLCEDRGIREEPGVEIKQLAGEPRYIITSANGYQVQYAPFSEELRYKNLSGEKGLFWVGEKPPPGDKSAVWLVEGLWDAITLYQVLDNTPIAAVLGKALNKPQLYELRSKTVFILFDADAHGYEGAKKSVAALAEYDAEGIIIELPEELGGDPNDALQKDRSAFSGWLLRQRNQYTSGDQTYVEKLFVDGFSALLTVTTGIDQWDQHLGGGFKPGIHVLGANPKVGKSSYATFFAHLCAKQGRRVIFNTTELSKTQQWARFASRVDEQGWAEIESAPTSLSPASVVEMRGISKYLRVVVGWSVNQLKYAMRDAEILVVDYLQRMPMPYSGESSRANVDFVMSELSSMARDEGKIVLIVSTLNRAGYSHEIKLSDFKESGSVEYIAATATGMRKSTSGNILFSVVANTRGTVGKFLVTTDLAHQNFIPGGDIPRGDVPT